MFKLELSKRIFKWAEKSSFEHDNDDFLKITLLGSCLTNFVINHHLVQENTKNNISIKVISQVLQQRSDVIVDLIDGKQPDIKLIQYYLAHGDWDSRKISVNGVEIKYAKWFTSHLVQKIKDAHNIKDDIPDLIVMDSLCDIRHNLYRYRDGWKTMLGKIQFMDQKISKQFNEDFKFIGLLSAEETIENIYYIANYFINKNNSLKIAYIHFPISTEYLDAKWYNRGEKIKSRMYQLRKELGRNHFLEIEIPNNLTQPVTDPSHPHYSQEIWNHFYPDTYKHCSKLILEFIS